MAHWIVKTEPPVYGWDRFVREGRASWDGVRNFQARNFLRAMRVGDECLWYHSGEERAIVGVARVTRAAYPDPTATEGDWVAVDLAPVRPLAAPVPLDSLKADPRTAGMVIVRQGRLSVGPVTADERAVIVALASGGGSGATAAARRNPGARPARPARATRRGSAPGDAPAPGPPRGSGRAPRRGRPGGRGR